MADVYKEYIEEVASVTSLDRTQVIRLALFTAAHSPAFWEVLEEYKKGDVSLPSPGWELWEDRFFLEVSPKPTAGEGGGVLQKSTKEIALETSKKSAVEEVEKAREEVTLPAVEPTIIKWSLDAWGPKNDVEVKPGRKVLIS